jgi:hypothetical protein
VILTQCALTDIYCELDYLSRDPQHFYLLQVKSVLEPAVKSVGETNSKSRRRLLLSLSEVYIRQFRVHEATTILKGLITLFDGLKYPDIIDRSRLDKLRILPYTEQLRSKRLGTSVSTFCIGTVGMAFSSIVFQAVYFSNVLCVEYNACQKYLYLTFQNTGLLLGSQTYLYTKVSKSTIFLVDHHTYNTVL